MKKMKLFVFGGLLCCALIGAGVHAYSGCNNEPQNNNGDCTYATGNDGSVTYFCEDSIIFHDCTKESKPTIQG